MIVKVKTWQEHAANLPLSDRVDERTFMRAEIDELRAVLASIAAPAVANGALEGEHEKFEDWCNSTQQRGPSIDDCWAIYQHGKAAAIEANAGPNAALVAALSMVRDYVVTMKGIGHEYQIVIDSALAAAGAAP